MQPLTEGMFGYSLLRPVANQEYYYDIFETAARFKCDIESWHTETGPGVFEAVRGHILDFLREDEERKANVFFAWL